MSITRRKLRSAHSLRRRHPLPVGVALALVACAGLTSPAFAQESDAGAKALDNVTVTGSRLVRKDLNAPTPTTVVSEEDIKMSGSSTIESVVNEFPQLASGITSSVNAGGGNGSLTANLRALGPNRTLTLLNGRRMAMTTIEGNSDMAIIPDALVQSVDMITGGASAVYGSDAIAGAVNFTLRKDFEGMEAAFTHGQTDYGDGEYDKYDFIVGGNFGAEDRGNAVLSISYTDRKPIYQAGRGFSQNALVDRVIDGKSQLVVGGSSSIPGGQLSMTAANRQKLIDAGLLSGSYTCDVGSINGIRFADGGQVLPYCNPDDMYNYGADNYLQRPFERKQFAALANYKITDNVEVYGEAYYSNIDSNWMYAPESATLSTAGYSGKLLVQNYATNPGLLPAVRDFLIGAVNAGVFSTTNDGADVLIEQVGRRLNDNGASPRYYNNERSSLSVVAGLRGSFEVGDGYFWNWDGWFADHHTRNDSLTIGTLNRARFQQGMNTTIDANGNVVCVDQSRGCVPVGGLGIDSISPEAIAFITPPLANYQIYDRRMGGATLAGTLFDLPAGGVSAAFGVEYRKDSYISEPSQAQLAGEYSSQTSEYWPVRHNDSYSVKEAFTELRVPILSGKPWAYDLAVEAAYRYSDYSVLGGVDTWKVGFEWAPTEWLRFRGAYNEAIRAPNLSELYRDLSRTFRNGMIDPCSASYGLSDAQKAICVSTGIPAAEIDTYSQSQTGLNGQTQGNLNLKEEKSETFTIGAVFSIPAISGLNFAIDYFEVDITDGIGTASPAEVINLCLTGQSVYCDAIHRLESGQPDYVDTPLDNLAAEKVRGLDFQGDYRLALDSFGIGGQQAQLNFTLLASFIFESTRQATAVSEVVDCVGVYDTVCISQSEGRWLRPDLKLNLSAGYHSGPLTVRAAGRMISGFEASDKIPNYPVQKVPAVWYMDLSAKYAIGSSVELFGGIDNVFDRQPPVIGTGIVADANVDPVTYDVLGRRYFGGIRVRF